MTMIDRILDVMLARGLNADEADVIAIIEALRDPTEIMFRARPVSVADRNDWERIWRWQIDAMLRPNDL
jgi:hypothetical protein